MSLPHLEEARTALLGLVADAKVLIRRFDMVESSIAKAFGGVVPGGALKPLRVTPTNQKEHSAAVESAILQVLKGGAERVVDIKKALAHNGHDFTGYHVQQALRRMRESKTVRMTGQKAAAKYHVTEKAKA